VNNFRNTKCHVKNISAIMSWCLSFLKPACGIDWGTCTEVSISAILPVVMEKLERYPWMQKIQPLHAPFQVMAVGCL
jgi:hypothetical protein